MKAYKWKPKPGQRVYRFGGFVFEADRHGTWPLDQRSGRPRHDLPGPWYAVQKAWENEPNKEKYRI